MTDDAETYTAAMRQRDYLLEVCHDLRNRAMQPNLNRRPVYLAWEKAVRQAIDRPPMRCAACEDHNEELAAELDQIRPIAKAALQLLDAKTPKAVLLAMSALEQARPLTAAKQEAFVDEFLRKAHDGGGGGVEGGEPG